MTAPKRPGRNRRDRDRGRSDSRDRGRSDSRPGRRRRERGRRRGAAPPRGGRTADGNRPSGERTGGAANRRRNRLAILALCLLSVVIYLPAVDGEFLWDDAVFTDAAPVREPSGLADIWFSPSAIENEGHYWPLVYTSFWLEHALWGFESSIPFHLTNILLHLLNTLLLWRLLRRFAVPGAFAAAAVFAVHPVHVEAVAWVIERKDVLSGFFYLTAAAAWFRFVETGRKSACASSLGLFTAGLLSKSIVVTLPAALLIVQWWRRGRILASDLRRLAPFALVAVVITLADLAYYAGQAPFSLDYSFLERTLLASRALWSYALKLLWPSPLPVIYPLWEVTATDLLGWAALFAALSVAAALWFARERIGRGPLAGAALFAVTLSPVLGFVDNVYMEFAFVADRYQYLASIGLTTALAAAGAAFASRRPGAVLVGSRWLAGGILAALSLLTWRQAGIYRDEITFFSHIVAANPEAHGAHGNLTIALLDAGRPEEALVSGRAALEREPDDVDHLNNLGLANLRLERLPEAAEYFERGRASDPGALQPAQNLAEVRRKQGRYEEAVEIYGEVLEKDGDFALAQAGMGETLFHLGRYEESLTALERALALDPELPMAATLHRLMGRSAEALGRPDAERFYERSLAADPRDTESRNRLAMLHFGQQRFEEALAGYRALLETAPEDAQTHTNLGATLFHLDRLEEAARSFERAAALDPSAERPRDYLEEVRARMQQGNPNP